MRVELAAGVSVERAFELYGKEKWWTSVKEPEVRSNHKTEEDIFFSDLICVQKSAVDLYEEWEWKKQLEVWAAQV